MSRQQIERGIDVAEAFGVDQSIFPLSSRAFRLVKKSPEVLTYRLAIARLVCSADDNVHSRPPLFAKIIAPACEDRVDLFEFDAHGQLRSL